MAEWLIESGIGECRAILVEHGVIVAARLAWDGDLRAGTVALARLVDRGGDGRRGTAQLEDGTLAQIDGLDRAIAQGSRLTVRVTRAAIAERGRTKLPHVRPAPDGHPRLVTLADDLAATGLPVRHVRPPDPAFDQAGWADLMDEAMTGTVGFPGGTLLVCPTPAMTLIDVDGALPARGLALAAARAVPRAIRRLDIGGAVGIDFPGLPARADRQAVDAALAEALGDWRGERTAMNGFGFVQLVARLEGPSLPARLARDPAGAAARALMRQAERVTGPGVLLLRAHPAVRRAANPGWDAELQRRTALPVRWQEDPGLGLHAAFAQAVAP